MTDALLWNEIGNIYLQVGSHKEAITAIKKAIDMNPDSGWFHYNLGQAYLLAGELGNALFLFRKSILLMDAPQDQAVVWNKIGDACRGLKDMESAIRAYKKADDLDMMASRSAPNTDLQPGKSVNPLETIRDKFDPDTNNLLSGLKRMITHAESSLVVQAQVDASQPENGGNGNDWHNSASVEADTRPSRSIKATMKSDLDLPVEPADNQQNNSCPAMEAENPVPAAKKTIIVIPDPNEIYQNLAPETKDGEDDVRDGNSNGPSNPTPNIANLEEILAKVHIYENITRVNPTNDRAWDTLGKLYKSLGRFKDAILTYQKAIEIAPEREVYYYYLGLLYSVEQQHDDAVEAFQLVLSKNPEYILAHGALAGVYHRMGLENKANDHIATALPRMINESAYNRACFHAICGDSELALEFLQLALENNDTTIEWIKSDPDLDPIRTDLRYQELVSGKEQPAPENGIDNYFSCELDAAQNRLLPILNHSLAR